LQIKNGIKKKETSFKNLRKLPSETPVALTNQLLTEMSTRNKNKNVSGE
jgi:hypothetical protein